SRQRLVRPRQVGLLCPPHVEQNFPGPCVAAGRHDQRPEATDHRDLTHAPYSPPPPGRPRVSLLPVGPAFLDQRTFDNAVTPPYSSKGYTYCCGNGVALRMESAWRYLASSA